MSKENDKIYEEAKKFHENLLRKSGGLDKWDGMNEDTIVRVMGFSNAFDWVEGMGEFEVQCRMQDSFWVAVNRYRQMMNKGNDGYVVSVLLGLGCLYYIAGFEGIKIEDEYKALVHYDDVDISDLEFKRYDRENKKRRRNRECF